MTATHTTFVGDMVILLERGVKGAEGGPRAGPTREYFRRNHQKMVETAQPMRQKAVQGLLSRFRWSPGPLIFDRFWADLNRALSALFSKGGQRGGFGPHRREPRICPPSRGEMLELSELNRFQAPQVDSETLKKFGFLTRILQDFSRIRQGLTRIRREPRMCWTVARAR